MRTLVATVMFLGAAFVAPAGAQQVIDFETNCGLVGIVGGVDFHNYFTCFTGPQYPYTAHSGVGRVYTPNSGAGGYSFDLASPSQFSGAWFAGGYGAAVNFNLFLSNALVGTSSSLTVSGTPTFLASGYAGAVDRVEVYSNRNDFYVMDDVTIGAAVVATPEPASLGLMATGLVGLFGVARRRRAAL